MIAGNSVLLPRPIRELTGQYHGTSCVIRGIDHMNLDFICKTDDVNTILQLDGWLTMPKAEHLEDGTSRVTGMWKS